MSILTASLYIAAPSSSVGSGYTPGEYHLLKAVLSSICKSYTDICVAPQFLASVSVFDHSSKERYGIAEMRSMLKLSMPADEIEWI